MEQDRLWQEKARKINNRQDRREQGQAKRNKQDKTRQDKQKHINNRQDNGVDGKAKGNKQDKTDKARHAISPSPCLICFASPYHTLKSKKQNKTRLGKEWENKQDKKKEARWQSRGGQGHGKTRQ